jgi:hypothetical protein
MSKEFCTGVKILLSRMESNPEEFEATKDYAGNRKDRWAVLIAEVTLAKQSKKSQHDTLTVDEINALYDGMVAARRKAFNARIMREILVDEEELSSSIAKAPKKFTLSDFQVQTAQKMGISSAEYALKIDSLKKAAQK